MLSLLFLLTASEEGKIPMEVANKRKNIISSKSERICSCQYVVKSTDSLTSITGGEIEKLHQLYKLNPYINLQLIQAGQVINIPKECDDEDEPLTLYYMNSPDFSKHMDMKRGGSLIFSLAYILNLRTYDAILELKNSLLSFPSKIRYKDGVWDYIRKDSFRTYILNQVSANGIQSSYNLMKYELDDRDYFFVELLDIENNVIDTYNPFGPGIPIGKFRNNHPRHHTFEYSDDDDIECETFLSINHHYVDPEW